MNLQPRKLPGTDVEVSPLGLGTVKLGRNQQVKYPAAFDLPTDAEIHRLLDAAQACGVTYLDTAPAYGVSEERLGKILAERGGGEVWTVGTKAGEAFEGGTSAFDFSPEHIERSVERSLRRLRRERVDIVLIHSDGQDERILRESGAAGVLVALKASGKIGAVGISTKTAAGGLLAFEMDLDLVMATYNPWHRDEEPVLDAAAARGGGVLIKKALGSGWLGPENAGDPNPNPTSPPVDPVAESFRFIFKHPGATAVVVGTLSPDHLRANAAAAAAALEAARSDDIKPRPGPPLKP